MFSLLTDQDQETRTRRKTQAPALVLIVSFLTQRLDFSEVEDEDLECNVFKSSRCLSASPMFFKTCFLGYQIFILKLSQDVHIIQ